MIKELEYILTIAEEKNISRAAQKLNITQSSLSQFLSTYEANLGCQLFIRTSSGTQLTYSGELFIKYAQRAVFDYNQIRNRLSDVNHLKLGKIKFAVGPERGSHLIPPILRSFHDKYPDIYVVIIQRNSNECISLLMDASVDLALLAIPRSLPRVPTEFIRKEEILILASTHHPVLNFAYRVSPSDLRLHIDLRDAARFDFILTSPNTVLRNVIEDLFREESLKLQYHYDNVTLAFGIAMAKQGFGLLIAQESLVEDSPDIVRLSIGRSGQFRSMVLAYPTNQYRSVATKAFAKEIHDALDL